MYTPQELKDRYKGVSSSSLYWFELSPKYFKDKIDRKIEEPDRDYLELGTKLHYYLLQPNEFDSLYIYLDFPTPKSENQREFCKYLSNFIDKNVEDHLVEAYNASYQSTKKSTDKVSEEAQKLFHTYNKYIHYLAKAGTYKDTLSYTTNSFLEDARKSIINHKVARDLLLPLTYSVSDFISDDSLFIQNEATIYWEHPKITVNGEKLVCKSKIDRLVIDHTKKTIQLIDLKTSAFLSKFREKFADFSYYRQMVFYWMAIHYAFSKRFPDKNIGDYKKETYLVVVQTNSNVNTQIPVYCEVFEMKESSPFMSKGWEEINENLLPRLAWHLETDLWDHTKDYYDGTGIEQL